MIVLAVSVLIAAAPTDTVLILRSTDESWRPFEQRLAAELQASGFTVRAVDAQIDPGGDIPSQLWVQCRDGDALAVIWFQPRNDGRVDAWVADKVTAKAVLRTYEQPNSGAERARLALRAVELLHASLLEVRLMAPNEQNEFPEVKRFAVRDPEKPHWIFGTGIGAVFTPMLRPQPLLELQLGYSFHPMFAVDVHAISSVFPTRVEGPVRGYGADVGLAILRAQVEFLPAKRGAFELGITAGTGAVLLWASGDTTLTGVDVHTEARVTWLLSWGLMGTVQLSDGIQLQVLAALGVTVPEIGIALAGTLQAWIGRPIIDTLLRLEFE